MEYRNIIEEMYAIHRGARLPRQARIRQIYSTMYQLRKFNLTLLPAKTILRACGMKYTGHSLGILLECARTYDDVGFWQDESGVVLFYIYDDEE